MSDYGWEPEYDDSQDRADRWERAEDDERRETDAVDRLRDHGDLGESGRLKRPARREAA